jgi:hypothetical protein
MPAAPCGAEDASTTRRWAPDVIGAVGIGLVVALVTPRDTSKSS